MPIKVTTGKRSGRGLRAVWKHWKLDGDVDAWHRGYKESMQGVRRRLLQRTAKEGGLLYVAELHGNAIVRKMDHLVCFLPGASLLCAASLRLPCMHQDTDIASGWQICLSPIC